MDSLKTRYLQDVQTALLEPNAEYTFHYDDFEIVIKPNKFTHASFSSEVPYFNFTPFEKFPESWTKTN